MSIKVNCPTCQKSVEWAPASTYRPFCSKRCQMIDLGEWASDSNSIPGSPSQPDIDAMSDEALAELVSSLPNKHNA